MDTEIQGSETINKKQIQLEARHENCDEFDYDAQNSKLEERLKSLKETMGVLKEQLVEEKEAWKREIDEALNVAKLVGLSGSCDHECCKGESQKSEFELESTISEPTLSEITILDYEQKLANYQEALTKAHTEKRNLLKRQLAANAYKRRLMEVENMCNMELLKVKQSVQFLQPLQALASGWDTKSMTENVAKFDEELTGKLTKANLETSTSNPEASKSDFVTMETLEHKLYSDFKDIASQMSPLSSHATCSSLCMTDDDEMMSKRIRSMSWYNNEMGHHSAFNPLM